MQRSGLILANRAYMDHDSPRSAELPSSGGNGGLLAALRPVIEPWDGAEGTTWIGAGLGRYDREWTDERGLEFLTTAHGALRHRRLYFDSATWNGHYAEVANSFLWPLVHLVRSDLPAVTGYYPAPAAPSEDDWESFLSVNTAFAEAAAEEREAPWCWVHDYQLTLVPGLLRSRNFSGKIGFFLHTPFPDVGVAKDYLGGHSRGSVQDVVRGMLGADLLGFQTEADVARFKSAAVALCGAGITERGLGFEGRQVTAGSFPVGIDVDDVMDVARRAAVSPRVAAARRAGMPVVVGLERGDFTKGIPERLRAITDAFRRGEKFAYIGIAAPTREGVRAYQALEATVENAAQEARKAALAAGGSFTHVRANVGWPDVVALQRDADVVFTSSLADGQNLVPLQAAVAQSLRPAAERAVVITGRDAGVATTFAAFANEGLASVDPLDRVAMCETLRQALAGSPGRISDEFVEEVHRRDAVAWARGFLAALEEQC